MKDLDPQVMFRPGGLDRAAHLRADDAAIAALRNRTDALVLPMWRGRPLLSDEGRAGLLPTADPMAHDLDGWMFLGVWRGCPLFAATLTNWDGTADAAGGGFLDLAAHRHPALAPDLGFRDLRSHIGQIDPDEGEFLATARALVGWHDSHGFCSRCGQPSKMIMAGWQRRCPSCGTPHFPRTDPVVIMLVLSGNSLLLGRSPGWPEGMYSLLAGFMEPGETLENAVRREVAEETGVGVGGVRYLASQPWPFPASLMIGCVAEATSRTIHVDPVELEDALWVSREELARIFAGEHPRIRAPRQGAIASYLMGEWLRDATGVRL